jgi:hypothetical protein
MAAVQAQVFRVTRSRRQEPDPMPRYDAAQRMFHQRDLRFRSQKRVTASARVFDETIPTGHARHVMTEYSAEVAHFLVEQRGAGVGIDLSGEQQRMTALNANVLVMIVAIDEVLIRVVSEKTRQRVSDARQGTIEAEVCGATSAAPPGGIRRFQKNVIVDVVAPQRAG